MTEVGLIKVDISNEITAYSGRSQQSYQMAKGNLSNEREPREPNTSWKKNLWRKSLNNEISTLKLMVKLNFWKSYIRYSLIVFP